MPEAEKYARQCLVLTGNDDVFKQTARLYLLRILGERFKQNPSSVDRTAFLQLVNDFLRSEKTSIVDDTYYQEMKRWAVSMPDTLKSIVGKWKDASDSEGLCHAFRFDGYEIAPDENGRFRLSPEGVTHFESGDKSYAWRVSGTINDTNARVTGSLESILLAFSGANSAVGRQTVHVDLMLSDDMMSLEGTANYGSIRASGPLADVAVTLMKSCPGERRLKLVRTH